MKKQFVLLAITLLLCLQGCVFYIPSFGKNTEIKGVRTSRDGIDNFLEIGKTSKEKIQGAWGNPRYNIRDRNIWVYIGLKTTGHLGLVILEYQSYLPEADTLPIKKATVLFIKFDKNDYLKGYELKKVAKGILIDVRQQAIEWDKSLKTQSK